MDCIFCAIIAGTIPSAKLYEDEKMLVFRDNAPQAVFHALAVPKAHIASAADIASAEGGAEIVGHIFTVISQKYAEWGLQGGFRVITNSGSNAAQSVGHLHFHILGGQPLPANLA
ncbi:MAG: HIT domain-containing protein [Oscillospiraceae bacterium]|nr:HIT domain-containing protein [Oscillospiraceae bacterium]